jgi:hypothetical protein
MQAYYETLAIVPNNHILNIQLPDTIPTGKIKVAVIYDVVMNTLTEKQNLMADFLNQLPLNDSGLTRNQIQNYIEQERCQWDE